MKEEITLGMRLHSLADDERLIKIGTKLGSGYFYVGQLGDFCMRMEEYANYARYEANAKALRAEISLKTILLKRPAYPAYTRKTNTKKELGETHYTFTDFTSDTSEWQKKANSAYKIACDTRSAVIKFIPFAQRRIVKTFEADKMADSAEPLVVIVEGNEDGPYWTCDEAKQLPAFGVNSTEGKQ